jgi:hypothetical protein
MLRMVIRAEIAIASDDRNLLRQAVTCAYRGASNGSSMVRRTAAHVLALAAWCREDLHDAVRWLGGDIDLFGTPPTPQALDQVTLASRVASAAGDAGGRARPRHTRSRRRRTPISRGRCTAGVSDPHHDRQGRRHGVVDDMTAKCADAIRCGRRIQMRSHAS